MAAQEYVSESDKLYGLKQSYESAVAKIKDQLLAELAKYTDVNAKMLRKVENLVNEGAMLWIEFQTQRFRLQIRPGQYRETNIPDEVMTRPGTEVELLARPELRRIGDGKGAGLDVDEGNVIRGCELKIESIWVCPPKYEE